MINVSQEKIRAISEGKSNPVNYELLERLKTELIMGIQNQLLDFNEKAKSEGAILEEIKLENEPIFTACSGLMALKYIIPVIYVK